MAQIFRDILRESRNENHKFSWKSNRFQLMPMTSLRPFLVVPSAFIWNELLVINNQSWLVFKYMSDGSVPSWQLTFVHSQPRSATVSVAGKPRMLKLASDPSGYDERYSCFPTAPRRAALFFKWWWYNIKWMKYECSPLDLGESGQKNSGGFSLVPVDDWQCASHEFSFTFNQSTQM